jgi:hypothetical protein
MYRRRVGISPGGVVEKPDRAELASRICAADSADFCKLWAEPGTALMHIKQQTVPATQHRVAGAG